MTKQEMVEALEMQDSSFDYALPQDWVDSLALKVKPLFTYDDIIFRLIWLYDDKAPVFGRPYPLDFIGKSLLRFAHIGF